MATAAKTMPPAPRKHRHGPDDESLSAVGRILWSIYRFLASLKLAVISLGLLAGVIAYATFYESWYGTRAVQERIYQSWWFGVLLAFLAANILCAALIRYPWKKRQIGFVVTHAGLLVVLLASVLTRWFCTEGTLAIVEDGKSNALLHQDAPEIVVRPLDRQTGKTIHDREYPLPFKPGPFAWTGGRAETLTRGDVPFQFRVKGFLPASVGRFEHHAAGASEKGLPMLALKLAVKPPNAVRPVEFFGDDVQDSERWMVARGNLRRGVKRPRMFGRPGSTRVVFQVLEEGWQLDDFLNPPDPTRETARLHYVDRDGKARSYDWVVGDSGPHGEEPKDVGKTIQLPDSDLSVTFQGPISLPGEIANVIRRQTGDTEFPGVRFEVRRGEGKPITHYGWWTPALPTVMPDRQDPSSSQPLLRVGYFHPPHFDGDLMSQLEFAATEGGKVYHRYLNRAGLASSGPVDIGETQTIGGGPNQPVSLTFAATEYLPAGVETFGFVAMNTGKGKQGDGIPAALVEMTVDGETKTFWIRGQAGLEPSRTVYLPDGTQQQAIDFADRAYEVGYEVERSPLPFSLKLVDFKRRFDPGTTVPKSYTSKVLLSDDEKQIRDQAATITMNYPLTHRGMTFYQSSFQELEDPMTGQPNGQFVSIFQARYDPVWPIMYFGCLLVVVGTGLQFYMRAGVFTDGGKKERERAKGREGRQIPASSAGRKDAEAAPDPEPSLADTL
ncbi:MAG: cytochrome c biogenesis protein ResB [Isosphaeraceae bacterium]